MFLGTKADNNRDMVAKARHSHGESHGAKLKESQVLIIRADRRGSNTVAAEFGVAPKTVRLIRKGEIWRHLLPATVAA